jgi:hypothetical protein
MPSRADERRLRRQCRARATHQLGSRGTPSLLALAGVRDDEDVAPAAPHPRTTIQAGSTTNPARVCFGGKTTKICIQSKTAMAIIVALVAISAVGAGLSVWWQPQTG